MVGPGWAELGAGGAGTQSWAGPGAQLANQEQVLKGAAETTACVAIHSFRILALGTRRGDDWELVRAGHAGLGEQVQRQPESGGADVGTPLLSGKRGIHFPESSRGLQAWAATITNACHMPAPQVCWDPSGLSCASTRLCPLVSEPKEPGGRRNSYPK